MTVQSAQVCTVLRSINYVHKHDTRHQYFKSTDAWVILAILTHITILDYSPHCSIQSYKLANWHEKESLEQNDVR